MTAAIYCRISQDRTGEGLGVARQEKDCRALAERLGLPVHRVYIDDDTSAYSGKPRPQYSAMMDDVRAGRVSAVICWHADRLHRSPRELESYIDATEQARIVTHTVTSGDLDLSTSSGRAVARTVGAWARFESEHKAERIGRKMRELSEAGKFTGGLVPFGWAMAGDGRNRHPVLVEDEANIVRQATERFLAGESIGALTRWVNSTGTLTRNGKTWKHITLRQVLRRPKNAGLATVAGEVVGPSTFPAIVTEEQWRAVVAELDRPDRLTASSSRVRHLLSGLARCGTCGGVMGAGMVKRSGQRITIYRCRDVHAATRTGRGGAPHPQRMVDPIDDYVTAVVIAYLESADPASLMSTEDAVDVQKLQAERASIRDSLNALAEQFAEGNITASQMGTASKRLAERLEGVTDRLEGAAMGSPLAEVAAADTTVRDWWDVAGIEHRRAVIDALCTVHVDPVGKGRARVFHPDTVRIEWKAGQ